MHEWTHRFFLPGELLIAYAGPLPVDAAWISVAFWLLVIAAAFYLVGFAQDAVDPTWRQQRREGREARRTARKRARGLGTPARRIEPTLSR